MDTTSQDFKAVVAAIAEREIERRNEERRSGWLFYNLPYCPGSNLSTEKVYNYLSAPYTNGFASLSVAALQVLIVGQDEDTPDAVRTEVWRFINRPASVKWTPEIVSDTPLGPGARLLLHKQQCMARKKTLADMGVTRG